MGSIFDIEEKLIKEIDEEYLISNGWVLKNTIHFGDVYVKTIHHKNRPSRFIKFCYHHDLYDPMLRNMNTWETIYVHDIMTFELQVNEWVTYWKNIYKQFFI